MNSEKCLSFVPRLVLGRSQQDGWGAKFKEILPVCAMQVQGWHLRTRASLSSAPYMPPFPCVVPPVLGLNQRNSKYSYDGQSPRWCSVIPCSH